MCDFKVEGYSKETGLIFERPCGSCWKCVRNKRREWFFRLAQENKYSMNSAFVSLTYDPVYCPMVDIPLMKVDLHDDFEALKVKQWKRENYEKYKVDGQLMALDLSDLQKFVKRLRKNQSKYTEQKLRFYACGEYGSKTKRPHYHLLLFNVHDNCIRDLPNIWSRGIVDIGDCTGASIQYTTNYMMKKDDNKWHPVKQFSTMSKDGGIGYQYLTPEIIKYHRTVRDDKKLLVKNPLTDWLQPMPRYYRSKIWNPQELDEIQNKNIERMLEIEAQNIDALIQKGYDPYIYAEELNEIGKKQFYKTLKNECI